MEEDDMTRATAVALGVLLGSLVYPRAAVLSDKPAEQVQQQARDSGRYGLSAACSHDDKWLNCQVSVRDLVYDTILVPERKLSATLEGGLGSSVQFEGHPAQGTRQRIGLAVGMAEDGPGPRLARVALQVHEGDHLIQDYTVTFPVAPKAK
jgi:hypothetical protein